MNTKHACANYYAGVLLTITAWVNVLSVFVSTSASASAASANSSLDSWNEWKNKGPHYVEPLDLTNPGNLGASTAIVLQGDVCFIGTVNGGVWKTNNVHVDSYYPHWEPLTDSMLCNSISALTASTVDPTVLVAGCGQPSNYQPISSELRGIMLTINHGNTWQMTQFPFGHVITTLLLIGTHDEASSIVLYAGSAEYYPNEINTNQEFTSTGLFRSGDGGITWTRIFSIDIYQLIADPLDNDLLITIGGVNNTPYVYVSHNQGGMWIERTDGLTFTGDCNNSGNMIWNAAISIHHTASTMTLYALWYSQREKGGNECYGLYYMKEWDGTWTKIFSGDQLGPQGFNNIALLADPIHEWMVYVGGTAFIRLRIDVSTSPPTIDTLTNEGAEHGANPHADVRYFEWDTRTNALFETNDGGLYIRTNPRGVGKYISLTGDITNTEFVSAMYEYRTGTYIGGAQDNSVFVSKIGTGIDGVYNYTAYLYSDGNYVDVDSEATPPLLYAANMYLSGLFVLTAGTQAITDEGEQFPLNTKIENYNIQLFAPNCYFTLNKVVRNKLMACTAKQASSSNTICYSLTFGYTNNGTAVVTPLVRGYDFRYYVYGGYKEKIAYPDAMIAVNTKYVYSSLASVNGMLVTAWSAPANFGPVHAIVADPLNLENVYVTNLQGRIFHTSDFGVSWNEVTGNVNQIAEATENAYSWGLAIIHVGIDTILLVGTRYGVYYAVERQPLSYFPLGSRLPNTPVSSLFYEAHTDVLVAGLMGRGIWQFNNITVRINQLIN